MLHAKALHGNPYDGHTLGPVIAGMEALTGVEARRIHVDKGYRGHSHPNKFRVWISGQVRRVTKTIRREMRRRAAVEPVIGHLKAEHRMERNYLKGRDGDRANAVLAAAGYNFNLLIRWFDVLSRALTRAILRAASIPLTLEQRTFFTGDEIVPAFLRLEKAADIADGTPQFIIGSRLCLSDQGLQFGEGHLNGIKVGRVFGQEQEPGADVGQRLCRPRTFVHIEIIEDDHIAASQARHQLGADIGIEGRAVHGLVDDPGGDKSITPQTGDEGLRVPLSERRIGHEPLSPWAASAQRCHVGLHTGFIQEDQPCRVAMHERLAALDPCPAGLLDVRAFFLRCQQRFFYS